MAADEAYTFKCQFCGASLKVKPEWAGRKAKCKQCQQSIVIPPPDVAAPPPVEVVSVPSGETRAGVLDLSQLRTSSESGLRVVCLIISVLVYILLIISITGLLAPVFVFVASYVGLAFLIAHVRGNGIKVGPDQLSQLYASACRASEALGLARAPEVYVIQEGGMLNAFATRFAFRRYVVMFSDLVEACGDNSAELDMVMGHEIGHLALKHIGWRWILLPAMFVPFLSQAYSRACEYSADRCGWASCGDKEAAMRGLLILAAGGNCGRMASLEAFLRQRDEVRGFWQTVIEWLSTHPWLTRRVAAVHALS